MEDDFILNDKIDRNRVLYMRICKQSGFNSAYYLGCIHDKNEFGNKSFAHLYKHILIYVEKYEQILKSDKDALQIGIRIYQCL